MTLKASILVVVGDHDTRVCLRNYLEAEGYLVVSAANGLDATQKLNEMSAPTVIILDMDIPAMSGSEFLSAICAEDKLAQVPVIQLGPNSPTLPRGISGVLQKPIEPKELIELVDKCIRKDR